MTRQTLRRLALVPAAVMASISPMAFAAIDSSVTSELATAKTDVLALGALVFAIAIGIVLYKWFKRAL
jgi:hypothetical protein